MAIPVLYDTDMGEQTIDISASTRKFQTSVIIQQDPNKNGILSFLEAVDQTIPLPPTRQAPQTMRPRRQQGGY
jgi:hypothetical protein